jgi:hypothetical protein
MVKKWVLVFLQGRYIYLFIALLLLLLLYPFFAETVKGLVFLDFLFTAVLLLGIYTTCRHKTTLIIALALGIPAMAGKWLSYFIDFPALILIGHIIAVLFFIFIIVIILGHVLRGNIVTTDTIYGAVCVYFLIGIAWAFLFSAIETLNPGSFLIDQVPLSTTERKLPHLLYYSFVTLTSLGLGDISPANYISRTYTYMEAIMGQFYMLILIARLVGLHIAGSIKRGP